MSLGGRNSADLAARLRNQDSKSKFTDELVVQDDECKSNVGVQVVTKVATDKNILAGVKHYCSVVAMTTASVYNRCGMPVVVWGAVLPEVTYGDDFKEVHRVNATMINQNEVAYKFIAGLGYKKWAIIHGTTDYGKGHNKNFSEFLKKGGGAMRGTFEVTADQQDFTTELPKICELNPDVIYFGGLTPVAVRIWTQMEKLGIKAQLQGTPRIKSDAYIQGVGKELAEDTLSFIEGAPWEKLTGGLFFISKYEQKKYGESAEAYGSFAFAATNLIMYAVKKVGPDRKKLLDVLDKTNDVDTILGKVAAFGTAQVLSENDNVRSAYFG
jgi:branched-chain amino acid transport system substrate-binding protein